MNSLILAGGVVGVGVVADPAGMAPGLWAYLPVAVFAVLVAAATLLAWRYLSARVRVAAESEHKAHRDQSYRELMALNAKLEHAAHEWRATADTIDAALIVLEPDGVIERMNFAAADTLPDALPVWLGRPSSWLSAYSPWNAALALVDDAVSLQGVVTDRVRDARNRTWDLWCRPMPERKRPTVLVMARDVSAMVDMQQSMRRSETMAQLGAIVSGVAHEVRNPLFAISSLVDAWAVQSHRDPRPFVEALRGEVTRLRILMEELLEYGRPGTAAAQEPHGLAHVIEGAIGACSHEAKARQVRVVAGPLPDADVVMDPRRLERVFINLIQNAIQHAPVDSAVRVETAGSEPAQVAVAVRDHGPGFAPEDLPRLFTPFFGRRPGGFGLGLAISDRIVSEHRGHLAAANDPGGGAVVTVRLPRAHVRRAAADRQVDCA